MSLSAELLDEALRGRREQRGGETATVALDALRHAAVDLERMLQALTQLSRARRRPLDTAQASLRLILGGHVVVSDDAEIERCIVDVAPMVVRELLDAIGGTEPCEVHVARHGAYAVLQLQHPLAADVTSPLEALAASLQQGAGAVVERLAVGQVLVERYGGALRCEQGHLSIWLPLSERA